MKSAKNKSGETIDANANAPEKAFCPYCRGIATLRSRRRSNQPGDVVYFWRHANHANPNCQARSRYDLVN